VEQRVASERLHGAIHVLKTEAMTLTCLVHLYETDPIARDGFHGSIEAITRHKGEKGKLVVVGVGKSGLIGKKLVATYNSLGIPSTFLHPTEALHGDLGSVGQHDTLLFITFSGKTQELLSLLPHIDRSLPLILLTSHTRPETCEFIRLRPDTILLPAPVHEPEKVSFGVSAPTSSTTAALAVGDAIAINAAKELQPCVSAAFAKNHPGGAIGAAAARARTIKDISVSWLGIPIMAARIGSVGSDVLRAGYDSKSGWVRIRDSVASPSRIRGLGNHQLSRCVAKIPGLFVARDEMLSISADISLRHAVDLISNMQQASDGEIVCESDTILAVMDKGDITGVLEVGQLLAWKDPV
jgi:D-arabinose 5-phosphate isomerase GutQ